MAECKYGVECLYDLDPDQCAKCLGHTGQPEKVRAAGPAFPSNYAGRCGHCDQPFESGTEVCAAVVDGVRVWVLESHTT